MNETPDANASPFTVHRATVLGHLPQSVFLQDVVLSLWNGAEHPLPLSGLSEIDAASFRIFVELATSFWRRGESNPAFMDLALAIIDRRSPEVESN